MHGIDDCMKSSDEAIDTCSQFSKQVCDRFECTIRSQINVICCHTGISGLLRKNYRGACQAEWQMSMLKQIRVFWSNLLSILLQKHIR